jgi:acyl-CoA synthetase (AMP-forming)/AMP-acid ligase II
MFISQLRLMRDKYRLSPQDIDMPGFAMFAVFSIAAGMTVVLPEMDPRKPAMVNPRKIAACINRFQVTFSFGSPALWKRVAPYCLRQRITFPSLKRILMAGAPIPWLLHNQYLIHILAPGAEIYTPYGATECLMTTSFQGTEVLAETMKSTRIGKGYCVGPTYPGITVKIIKISDQPLKDWGRVELLPDGTIGEIVVSGPTVSPAYFAMPEHTEWHKIYEYEGDKMVRLWHRLGDVGYLDEQRRLWFCGRQSQRVETGDRTYYTGCCEAIFNEHPQVNRSALVGIGSNRYRQRPVMVIEPESGKFPYRQQTRRQFIAELLELACANPLTTDITDILFHRRFPVDIRHNAKIFREQLTLWASSKLSL